MSKARLVITAVEIEGLTQADAARRCGVSKGWVSKLMARYRAEGGAAYESRSRARKTSPTATPAATVDLVLRLRKQLVEAGLDAGADIWTGTCATATRSRCPGPRSTGSWPAPGP